MATVTIDVTADDIARGLRHSAYFCPISWAVRRCLNRTALVFPDSIKFIKAAGEDEQSTRTPDEAARRLLIFDESGVMEPFSFELTLPDRETLIPWNTNSRRTSVTAATAHSTPVSNRRTLGRCDDRTENHSQSARHAMRPQRRGSRRWD